MVLAIPILCCTLSENHVTDVRGRSYPSLEISIRSRSRFHMAI